LVILGYIFAILGGIIGAIIGLYLYTRDDSYYKVHGRNILIIASIVIIIGIGVTAFAFQSLSSQLSTSVTNQSPQSNITYVQNNQQSTVNTQSITSTQARNIADNYAQSYAPGASAGTATLNGNTYTVPIYGNGALVGEVVVNAQTGKVVDHWFQELPTTEADVT
jgi:K+-sensing histidine kinase KdpD